MSDSYWILEGKTPRAVGWQEWGAWSVDFEKRRLALDEVGEVRVSTVFLCVDHGFGREPRPVLFETMVFGGPLDQETERYADYDEAMAGHEVMLARVRETEGKGE